MKWISVKDRLPPNNTYVLAHHTLTNWHDADGHYEIHCVVVKFIRGLSAKDREAMDEVKRKRTYCAEDEWGNNKRPYHWEEFGPNKFFGQDVDFWMPLPKPPKP